MADRNVFQIRHGSEEGLLNNPDALAKYELGFTDEGALYIKDKDGNIIAIGGNKISNLGTLVLSDSMYGTANVDEIEGATEGQVYFKLVE